MFIYLIPANDKSDVDHVTSQGKIKPIGGGHVEQENGGRIPVELATTNSARKFGNLGGNWETIVTLKNL